MVSKKQLVEVSVDTEEGRVPLGIMNARQALALPDDLDVEISHPDHEPGNTDRFIQKDELRRHLDVSSKGAGKPVKTRAEDAAMASGGGGGEHDRHHGHDPRRR
ncbi:hypothetical protein [Rhizobium sp. H4]|uniref:hypothetical protein n=1 Tax=Rhizobium sp. H4 TaxID=2035449 RepID=UPI001FE0A6E6|nr:hypothetical protein [Rhizobium sp. H4]